MMRQEPFTVEQQKNLAQQYRETAAWWRDRGHEDVAIAYETTADSLGATCPHCGGDLLGAPPVDGRDVDTPPKTAAELSRQSIKANAEKQQAAIARRDRPTPADQIRRDEATRKARGNP